MVIVVRALFAPTAVTLVDAAYHATALLAFQMCFFAENGLHKKMLSHIILLESKNF